MKSRILALIVMSFVCGVSQHSYGFYNPSTGRWLSRDPVAEPGFMVTVSKENLRGDDFYPDSDNRGNPYDFVGNRPIDLYDLLGLKRSCEDICKDALTSPDVSVGEGFGGVVCDSDGTKCPCALQFIIPGTKDIYHPGECPNLDKLGSSTFLMGKKDGIWFDGRTDDSRKDVS